jgi:hypothetical protein
VEKKPPEHASRGAATGSSNGLAELCSKLHHTLNLIETLPADRKTRRLLFRRIVRRREHAPIPQGHRMAPGPAIFDDAKGPEIGFLKAD